MNLAFSIAIEFSKNYRKKYGKIPYNIRTVKTSKWWKDFENSTSYIEEGNVEKFIKYLFEQDFQDRKVLPYVLSSKKVKDIYKDFKDGRETIRRVSPADRINYTLKELSNWCYENKVNSEKLKRFVNIRSNAMKIERGTLYEPIFLFSKAYMKGRAVENYDIRKALFKKNHYHVYEVLKKISGDDFLE